MRILNFKQEVNRGAPYGARQGLLPGIYGDFQGLEGSASEPVNGFLVGKVKFERNSRTAFTPIGYLKINDHGSLEYLLVGVDALNSPRDEECRRLFHKVVEFCNKNFIVATIGGPEAAERLLLTELGE